MNEIIKNDYDEMRNRSDMLKFLTMGSGLLNTGNSIDCSDEVIAEMMELYKKKSEAGTLDPEYA